VGFIIHGIVSGLLLGGGISVLLTLLVGEGSLSSPLFGPGPMEITGLCIIFMVLFTPIKKAILRGYFPSYLASLLLFAIYHLLLESYGILPATFPTFFSSALALLPAIYYLYGVYDLSLSNIPPRRRAEEFRDLGSDLPHPHPG